MTTWDDKPRDWGSLRSYNIGHLEFNKRKYEADPAEYTKFSADDEWLMGFAIPPFQRGLEWDVDRMVKFIETLVEKGDAGTWSYHESDQSQIVDGREIIPRDLWLIDGRQRLESVNAFLEDQFPVFGLRWSEVEKTRKTGFLQGTTFACYVLKNKTEYELREIYDRKNFGGVAHREDQRALPGFRA